MFGQIGSVLGLLPKVLAVVTLVEDFLDPGTPGPEKKALALEFLRESGLPDVVVQLAGPLIDITVTVLNRLGVFEKPGEEPAVAVRQLAPQAAALRSARESGARVNITDEVFAEFLDDTDRSGTSKE